MKFYMTFACVHPLHAGWIEVEAPSYEDARRLCVEYFWNKWATLYDHEPKAEFFPRGKLGEMKT